MPNDTSSYFTRNFAFQGSIIWLSPFLWCVLRSRELSAALCALPFRCVWVVCIRFFKTWTWPSRESARFESWPIGCQLQCAFLWWSRHVIMSCCVHVVLCGVFEARFVFGYPEHDFKVCSRAFNRRVSRSSSRVRWWVWPFALRNFSWEGGFTMPNNTSYLTTKFALQGSIISLKPFLWCVLQLKELSPAACRLHFRCG